MDPLEEHLARLRQARTNWRVGAIAVGALIVAVSGGIFWWAYSSAAKQRTTEGWPSAEGVITRSDYETKWIRGADGPPTQGATLYVAYEYTVDGRRFTGRRVAYGVPGTNGDATSNMSYVRDLEERFPEGETVPVRYDPENPERSVLLSGLQESNRWFVLGSGAAFAAIGWLAVVGAAEVWAAGMFLGVRVVPKPDRLVLTPVGGSVGFCGIWLGLFGASIPIMYFTGRMPSPQTLTPFVVAAVAVLPLITAVTWAVRLRSTGRRVEIDYTRGAVRVTPRRGEPRMLSVGDQSTVEARQIGLGGKKNTPKFTFDLTVRDGGGVQTVELPFKVRFAEKHANQVAGLINAAVEKARSGSG